MSSWPELTVTFVSHPDAEDEAMGHLSMKTEDRKLSKAALEFADGARIQLWTHEDILLRGPVKLKIASLIMAAMESLV